MLLYFIQLFWIVFEGFMKTLKIDRHLNKNIKAYYV
jgi:hypothetical protein